MKTSVVMETKDARKMNRRGLLRDDLETYYSPLLEVSVHCSTSEREECERDQGRDVCAADVLTADAFAVLCTWLKDNAGLKLSGVYRT